MVGVVVVVVVVAAVVVAVVVVASETGCTLNRVPEGARGTAADWVGVAGALVAVEMEVATAFALSF